MALDVYLQEDAGVPKTFNDCFLQFENDGYYGFLYSFFEELAKESGQMIDLSDDAFFKGNELDLLNRTIQKAKNAVLEKPDVWEEFIETTFEKGVRTKVEKIFSIVHKKELESMLSKLETAVIKAKEKNIGILFFGD